MLVGLESSKDAFFYVNPVPTQGEPPKSINMVLCTTHTQRDHRPIPTVDSASPKSLYPHCCEWRPTLNLLQPSEPCHDLCPEKVKEWEWI